MTGSNLRIFLKGEDRTASIKDCKCLGDKYQITFNNGKEFTYNARNVRIVKSALYKEKSRNCFDYLKRIAEVVGLPMEVESGRKINILLNSYSKIDFIPPDGMLATFLSGELPSKSRPIGTTGAINRIGFDISHVTFKYDNDPVYPFGFNISQKIAVDLALENPLSVVEGPPGTGKTQTILNIIANAVMRGESVAVISSNNSATRNVLEKLNKYGVGFIAAYLGNSMNKRDFVDSQKKLPDINGWKLDPQTIASMRHTLKSLYIELHKKLSIQNELSALKQEVSALQTEQKHFMQFADSILSPVAEQPVITIDSPQQALEMWLFCEFRENTPQKKGFISFIKSLLERIGLVGKRKRKTRKLLEEYPQELLIAIYQRCFYELRIAELSKDILDLTNELTEFDFDAKMREYSYISAGIFRAKLAEKYMLQTRTIYTLDDLWKNSEAFVKDYPIILSTAYSLRSSLSNRVMYDYVIVDESSQVDICTGALALSAARKAVIVGDLKQLPNVVDSKDSAATDAVFTDFDLSEIYRYKNHNLLSALTEMFPNIPSTLLREHYRCHPKIIEFCNTKFYDGQLVVLTEPKSNRAPLLVYKTTEGRHERNRMNQRQIDVILNEIIPQQNLNTRDNSLGIVTPYRNQTNALQKAFSGTGVKADTVDKFQGQEKDVIILSTVDNEITEFTDNANRLNVAVSRAVEQLIVVVSDSDLHIDTNIGDLVRYIEYNSCAIVESTVYSVFDYLYKSYSERRREFLRKHRKVSEYDSENLMYALITNVLADEQFTNYDVTVHVPLRMIVRDFGKLSALEIQYAGNMLTHVDFLIFDKMSKTPRLVIEVDGTAFHADGSRQSERDAMKNDILRKCNLPIIRFRTDGSDEHSRLVAALKAVDCL